MTYYIKNGNTFSVTSEDRMDIRDKLPAENFTVKFSDFTKNFYLESVDAFEIKGKIYGDLEKRATRIINTFKDRTASTGVLLSGEKGSGKTLLTKLISNKCKDELGIPTLIINTAFTGDDFNQFIQSIDQPAVILFDEFEKVYDRDDQSQILTLLDGTYPTKKLFLLTCNDKYRIDSHMTNRPGRIYYSLEFSGLESTFVREYCVDQLNNQKNVDGVVKLAGVFAEFNFDMLKALVEEMNRYDESASEAIEMLNAKNLYSDGVSYTLTVTNSSGQEMEMSDRYFTGSPFRDLSLWTDFTNGDKDFPIHFSVNELVSVDPVTETVKFKNEDGYIALFERRRESKFNFAAF